MESTNYDKLNQMIKDFAPYSNLWITTDNWYKNIDNWKNNAFDSVDAPFAERFVDDGLRTLQGSLRYFKDKDISLIAKIAQTVKAEFD
jgi:dynein heavy chain